MINTERIREKVRACILILAISSVCMTGCDILPEDNSETHFEHATQEMKDVATQYKEKWNQNKVEYIPETNAPSSPTPMVTEIPHEEAPQITPDKSEEEAIMPMITVEGTRFPKTVKKGQPFGIGADIKSDKEIHQIRGYFISEDGEIVTKTEIKTAAYEYKVRNSRTDFNLACFHICKLYHCNLYIWRIQQNTFCHINESSNKGEDICDA